MEQKKNCRVTAEKENIQINKIKKFLERTHTKNPPSMSKDKHQLLSAILFETWKRANLNNILLIILSRPAETSLLTDTHYTDLRDFP